MCRIKEREMLFALYKVQVILAKSGVGQDAPILEDPGSTDKFMVHALAEELQLPSKPVAAKIMVPGDQH